MPAIITDTFDYDDIVRVLDLDEAFVHHQIDALQPKYWRIVIKTKTKGLKIFAPLMVSGNRGIDYMIYMLSRDWQITSQNCLFLGMSEHNLITCKIGNDLVADCSQRSSQHCYLLFCANRGRMLIFSDFWFLFPHSSKT